MTESEWFAHIDPKLMLEFLPKRTSRRKLRLFAVACCRRIWHLLRDQRSRTSVGTSERFADKLIQRAQLLLAKQQALMGSHRHDEYVFSAENAAAAVARATIDPQRIAQLTARAVGNDAVSRVPKVRHSRANAVRNEAQCQADLLRDIFGHLPFRPLALNPAWLSLNVRQLAGVIYEERAFDRLPILGDALEDASCDDPDILDHCLQPGEHVRGCWCLDLLLGRE